LFCELGSKFEPYVDHILPSLLASFSDPNPDVREAAAEASAQIMANLTGYGVQRALPRVLGALEEKGWKTKVESVTLLGSMAYCAPRQLSSCLPQIVPRLLEVMTDPNKKLQESTRSALSKIGSVIRNPEIRLLVPRLLKAISDPTANTEKALQSLMKTSFVHAVDPASLALIIPILRRGLRDRVSHVKKMAAQVVGSMCSLIADTNDLLPYASTLLKYLKMIIVDNIPEVRAVGARSLGALFKGLGEDNCGDLVTYLIALLDSDTTAVQRAGAAQALANIMKGLGPERTEELLPGISDKARTSQDANVREAYMGVYQYMPDTFGTEFAVYLEDVFPCVVAGLADDIGTVRDVALKSGQALVIKFARSETDMLLPALETGIRSGNWRIRLSSVQLLGSLLLRLSGNTAVAATCVNVVTSATAFAAVAVVCLSLV
jgi:HEAT repeat protein